MTKWIMFVNVRLAVLQHYKLTAPDSSRLKGSVAHENNVMDIVVVSQEPCLNV